MPDNTPPLERKKPGGRLPPVTANVYGAVPPLALLVWLYAVPILGIASVAGLIVIAGQFTAKV
jgi:hypothetical protein